MASGSYSHIVALDLGKYNTVSCRMDVSTRQYSFDKLVTTPQDLHDWLSRQVGPTPAAVLVVFETCDIAGWVYDLVLALGCQVAVANPFHDAWRWKKVKRKTDREDALKLAKMALLDQLPTVHMPLPQQRQKRRLIQHRRSVVRRRTQSKNAIRSISSQQGLMLTRGNKQWTAAGLQQLREQAREIASCNVEELWRERLQVELDLLEAAEKQVKIVERKLDELADERVKLLCTVQGVGPRLAEAVVLCLDDVHRFKSAREVSSYVGLVPKQLESGQMKRVGRITRRGPSLLRGLLVEVAWMVYRHNAWARAFVDRVSRGIKGRKKIAIVALARKLLVKLWAMLKHNQPWREPEVEQPAASPA